MACLPPGVCERRGETGTLALRGACISNSSGFGSHVGVQVSPATLMKERYMSAPSTSVAPDQGHGGEQLSAWRTRLEEERSFLLHHRIALEAEREALSDLDDEEPAGGLRAAVSAALAEVDAALARMSRDQYGFCLGCGEPIPTTLLDVRPMMPLCASCEETRQQRVRQDVYVAATEARHAGVAPKKRQGGRRPRFLSRRAKTVSRPGLAVGTDAAGRRS